MAGFSESHLAVIDHAQLAVFRETRESKPPARAAVGRALVRSALHGALLSATGAGAISWTAYLAIQAVWIACASLLTRALREAFPARFGRPSIDAWVPRMPRGGDRQFWVTANLLGLAAEYCSGVWLNSWWIGGPVAVVTSMLMFAKRRRRRRAFFSGPPSPHPIPGMAADRNEHFIGNNAIPLVAALAIVDEAQLSAIASALGCTVDRFAWPLADLVAADFVTIKNPDDDDPRVSLGFLGRSTFGRHVAWLEAGAPAAPPSPVVAEQALAWLEPSR